MTHEPVHDDRRSMKWTLIITTAFLFVEIAGGLISGSLALLSDLLSLLLSIGR